MFAPFALHDCPLQIKAGVEMQTGAVSENWRKPVACTKIVEYVEEF
jgi:hypothetical protein